MENRKDIFKSNYKGPRGRHLSCLTETSRYGDYKPENQKSIHADPRSKAKKANRNRAKLHRMAVTGDQANG
jgi:hypothetical protein